MSRVILVGVLISRSKMRIVRRFVGRRMNAVSRSRNIGRRKMRRICIPLIIFLIVLVGRSLLSMCLVPLRRLLFPYGRLKVLLKVFRSRRSRRRSRYRLMTIPLLSSIVMVVIRRPRLFVPKVRFPVGIVRPFGLFRSCRRKMLLLMGRNLRVVMVVRRRTLLLIWTLGMHRRVPLTMVRVRCWSRQSIPRMSLLRALKRSKSLATLVRGMRIVVLGTFPVRAMVRLPKAKRMRVLRLLLGRFTNRKEIFTSWTPSADDELSASTGS